MFNLATDLGENKDLAAQNPDVLEQFVTAYNKYASDVGIIIPRGESFETTAKKFFPIANQENVQIINFANNLAPRYPLNDTSTNCTHTIK